MHPIFFAWQGSYEELLALTDAQTGTWFYSHGRTRTIPVGENMFIGIVEASHPNTRRALVHLSPNFVLLPGANGKLDAAQARFLTAMLPSLNIKEGDPCAVVLFYVHKLYNDHEFNANNY